MNSLTAARRAVHITKLSQLSPAATLHRCFATPASPSPFSAPSPSHPHAKVPVPPSIKVKFEGGNPMRESITKTQYAFFSLVALASLLGGASIVHNIYKPDLTLPDIQPKTPAPSTDATKASK